MVTADQAGNTQYGPAVEVTRSSTVNKITPTAALSSSVSTILAQNALTLTATVASGVSTPTGTVSFLDGSTSIGTGTLSSGVATLSVSTLAVGSHSITATYSGDANFNGASRLGGQRDGAGLYPDGPCRALRKLITAGATATFTFPITLTGGTTLPAAVTFSASGAPSGATVTFTPASLAAGSTPTTVAMAVYLKRRPHMRCWSDRARVCRSSRLLCCYCRSWAESGSERSPWCWCY